MYLRADDLPGGSAMCDNDYFALRWYYSKDGIDYPLVLSKPIKVDMCENIGGVWTLELNPGLLIAYKDNVDELSTEFIYSEGSVSYVQLDFDGLLFTNVKVKYYSGELLIGQVEYINGVTGQLPDGLPTASGIYSVTIEYSGEFFSGTIDDIPFEIVP